MPQFPTNAIAAVQHQNPYPYYAALRQGPALWFDPELQLWIAATAEVIRQVMAAPAAAVRPAHEAVPTHLQGNDLGKLFAQLIRMTDGAAQQQAKAWLQTQISDWSEMAIREHTLMCIDELTTALAHEYQQPAAKLLSNTEALNDFIQRLPVTVMARLLGFPAEAALASAQQIAAFIRCLAPDSATAGSKTASPLQTGEQACHSLFHQLQTAHTEPLAPWQLANLFGLLMQSYEATAGLIGNSLVALTEQQLWPQLRAKPELSLALVAEVARFNAPVQNTRRFIHHDCTIAGIKLPAGSVVLLLLGSAGRDEAAYSKPDEFQLGRATAENLTFSTGAHRCPGQALAQHIAAVAVEFLLAQQLPAYSWQYRPSANGRLSYFCNAPHLTTAATTETTETTETTALGATQ
ncbi:MAG: cytochrome P450 [Gammaproteobacteria bacterium]|nr:cytochrome P450 [Gammaproteobacteria bacterium]